MTTGIVDSGRMHLNSALGQKGGTAYRQCRHDRDGDTCLVLTIRDGAYLTVQSPYTHDGGIVISGSSPGDQ